MIDNEKGQTIRSKNYKKCYLDYEFMKDFVHMKMEILNRK
jgi:hypothetical protein